MLNAKNPLAIYLYTCVSPQVLTLAVLAILITAPIGSAIIALVGPRLLHRTEPHVGGGLKGATPSNGGVASGNNQGPSNGGVYYDNQGFAIQDEGKSGRRDPSTNL